ncbi:hypothetical protein HY970_00280 [Candidatus Kaiserbacteria bacterium]|nr:hypothetical protein [Candidatus Kaiserbacteria bacterium]
MSYDLLNPNPSTPKPTQQAEPVPLPPAPKPPTVQIATAPLPPALSPTVQPVARPLSPLPQPAARPTQPPQVQRTPQPIQTPRPILTIAVTSPTPAVTRIQTPPLSPPPVRVVPTLRPQGAPLLAAVPSPISVVRPTAAPQSLPARKGGVGAMVGTVIIVVLFMFGALYFWGRYLNAQDAQTPLPLIPGNSTSQS